MAKKLAIMFGVVFVIVGLLGLVSNPIVGASGIFKTNLVHDVIHVALGIILLVGASSGSASGTMKLVGVVYLLVAVLGFVIAKDGQLFGLVDVNTADNYLHVVLALALLAASFMKDSSSMGSGGMGMVPPSQP